MTNHNHYYNTIKTSLNNIITTPQPILLWVSGGADSICLLAMIQERRTEQSRDPSLIHILSCDHNTRENTKNEVLLVQSTAQNNSFHSATYTWDDYSEQTLRQRRHQKFITYCKEIWAKFLLLGHHLDDRIETTLLNLKRGCGQEWFLWMNLLSDHFLEKDIKIIRPLLFMTKKEILTEVERLRLPYSEDPTNQDITYSERNLIRDIIGKYLSSEWRYRSFSKLYQINEEYKTEKKISIHETEDNIIQLYKQQENTYLTTIKSGERTPDIVYELYKKLWISLNPRSETLNNLCKNLNKSSGNKISYQWVMIQTYNYASVISIIQK